MIWTYKVHRGLGVRQTRLDSYWGREEIGFWCIASSPVLSSFQFALVIEKDI